jgi:agmatinase
VCPAVQVGIRSLSVEEAKAIPQLNTKVYWAKDIARIPLKSWVAKVLDDLNPNVYLTVDLDGFDPAYVPATGTPEPGGLDWYQVMSLIRAVAGHKKIVGMDVVELLPQPGDHASDFLAAKLIYKTLGYVFCQS